MVVRGVISRGERSVYASLSLGQALQTLGVKLHTPGRTAAHLEVPELGAGILENGDRHGAGLVVLVDPLQTGASRFQGRGESLHARAPQRLTAASVKLFDHLVGLVQGGIN